MTSPKKVTNVTVDKDRHLREVIDRVKTVLSAGDLNKSVELLRHNEPDDLCSRSLLNDYALLLLKTKQASNAERWFDRILKNSPDNAKVWNNLGIALDMQNRLVEARAAYEKAIEQDPGLSKSHASLARVYIFEGRHDEAIVAYRKALHNDPDNIVIYSNFLHTLHYVDSVSQSTLLNYHKSWSEKFEKHHVATIKNHANRVDPNRRLRIGYVSGDLWKYSFAYFIGPIFAAHDQKHYEIFCYVSNPFEDELTRSLRARSDAWRDISAQSEEEVAATIRRDQIDILVDLSGHNAKNKLLVFVRKPAPVQVSYLGYPGTTGLTAIDYRIVDSWTDPPGAGDSLHTEALIRVPDCFLCYRAPDNAPDVSPLPALTSGYVTFASFNNPAKVSPNTVKLWCAILRALPPSRLLIKADILLDTKLRETFIQRFIDEDISADRIEVIGRLPSFLEHLQLYGRVDIALDPTPYNGTITTCESLWMGVPVITLAGERHSARLGVSLLSAVGLVDFIASDRADYINIAVEKARDLTRLSALRETLRKRMAHSPLCNPRRLTMALERSYRAMWQRWCADHAKQQDRAGEISRTGRQSERLISSINNALQTGDHRKLVALIDRLIAFRPINASLLNESARALLSIGRPHDAERCLRVILSLDSKFAGVWTNLGVALKQQERIAEAIKAFRKELDQHSNMPKTLSNLAGAYSRQGRHQKAIETYRRAIAQDPADHILNSNMLLSLQYVTSISPRQLLIEHKAWAQRHAVAAQASITPHTNIPDRDRPIRIGYVSADLKSHPVAFFIGPILAAHDRTQVTVYCYASTPRGDALTQNLQTHVDVWRDISSLSDDESAALIRQDSIDILVDLAGHTARNRLMLFSRKPAPVQVTYLGYPGTTGLPTIDYRLTDAWADPPGSSEDCHTETLVRLTNGFLCYRAPSNAPAIVPPPALSTGFVTFASFNNSAKLSPPTIELWAKILTALPNSRLLLKSSFLGDVETQQYFCQRFRQHGVDSSRIKMLGRTAATLDHLRMYSGVDVALDPTPYCGTTTTCEALWMGVPVITLAGDRHSSRVGVSLLSVTGLTEFIASNSEEYVQIARHTARDLDRLAKLRQTLRKRVRQSPLCDPKRLALSLEEAYRSMWCQWCERSHS